VEVSGLAPFDPQAHGGWTRRLATHLLWRTGYGATAAEIAQAADDGLEKTLDRLLTRQEESDEFRATEPLLRRIAHDTGNVADLKAWWLYRMLYSANPLVEKMAFFWHNHFATAYSKVQSVEHMAAQNDLFRREAVGDFRALLHGMARDVAMLIWLDGNANRKRQPNENFARELMELFSLGEGNYTEEDIKQAARAFTGWHVRANEFWFNRTQHDEGQKTVFGRSGNFDGGEVVELCLEQPACPRFLASKLLRDFVMPGASDERVDQLAGRIRAHNFAFTPVLRELFGSRLFYSDEVRQALIKSPLDLVAGAQRTLGCRANLQATVPLLAELGQNLFEPPTVKGWEGGRLWINSAMLLKRANFAAELVAGGRFGPIAEPTAERTSQDPQTLVSSSVELLLARDLDSEASQRLTDYVREARGEREERRRGLIHLIMTMPEFQLM
jgi:uncharacterized protein (DUF1800 family)